MIVSESMKKEMLRSGNEQLLEKVVNSDLISELDKSERKILAKETARHAVLTGSSGQSMELPVVTTLSPLAERYLQNSINELSKDEADQYLGRQKKNELSSVEKLRQAQEIGNYSEVIQVKGQSEDMIARDAGAYAKRKGLDVQKVKTAALFGSLQYKNGTERHKYMDDDEKSQILKTFAPEEEEVGLKEESMDEFLARKFSRFQKTDTRDEYEVQEEKRREKEERDEREDRYPTMDYEYGEKEMVHPYYG